MNPVSLPFTPTAHQVASFLWCDARLPARALPALDLPGAEPVLPSSFAVATMLQASLGAATLAAAEIGRLRGGPQQHARVAARDVLHEASGFFRLDGLGTR